MREIDYSLLGDSKHSAGSGSVSSDQPNVQRFLSKLVSFLVPTIFVVVVGWVVFLKNLAIGERAISLVIVSIIAVSLLFAFSAPVGVVKYIKTLFSLPKFIRANNWSIRGGVDETSFAGQIFRHGKTKFFKILISVPADNLFAGQGPINFGNYTFSDGDINHTYGFVRIKLQRPLPHILIDGRQNNLFALLSNLPIEQRRDQLLKLSIGFDKHFNTYVPKSYERDALEILTLDLMSDLVEYGSSYDFEIIDNEFYIFSSLEFDLLNPAQYEKIFKLVAIIVEKVDAKSGRYKDYRATSGDSVALPGRRLNERKGFD